MWQQDFLRRHQLGAEYLKVARLWFDPLAENLAMHHSGASRPLLLGINGCQGSGKSTLVDYLAHCLQAEHGLRCVTLSLDDFYLTRTERERLSREVHPLFVTRGVPGTHDVSLLLDTLDRLLSASEGELFVPRFNKAEDDRHPPEQWTKIMAPVDIILFEGWCLGVEAQPTAALREPVNALERDEDAGGIWRGHVNRALATEFPPVYALVDRWLMLQAPSFACVQQWRQEQEDKLRQRLGPDHLGKSMTPEQVARFIQHYQRLTEWSLVSLPERVDDCLVLDESRKILRREGA
ncbi:hypothetical protein FV139_16330 [Parahaliea maris]|uniref:Kinase n=1 Tax=Parahaliea maris TaxID=2716870 RepID=A0A5C8ZUP9_9GAMM|nr:hypothetical protein [Parahaliea maris]TXS91302.1 hypothetical protein FV139_16330 [Parahaliea maris]